MHKALQPEDFPMAEAPPAYFPTVIAQPTAFQQPENYPPGPYVVPAGVYQGQFGQPTTYPHPAAYPGQNAYYQPSFGQMGHVSQDNIGNILATHDKLSFHSNQTISCGNQSLIVQIRGSQNQLVMSTLMTTITVGHTHIHGNDNHHNTPINRSTITFNDPTGRNLMTSKETTMEFTVTAGDRLLGVLTGAAMGCFTCCGSDVSAQNSNGELYFEAVKQGPEIAFVANGVTIATAKKGVVNGDDFGVEFTPSVGPDTKAMVVAAAYYLYVIHFAETACGCSGSLTLARFFLLIPLAMMLIMIIIIVVFATSL